MASALGCVDAATSVTERFCAAVKAHGFSGYGDTGYWSRRIKELAFITTEYLTGIAFTCSPHVNSAIADERRAIIKQARAFAFDGYGDSDFWSGRCKDFAESIMRAARRLERSIVSARHALICPLKDTSIERRVARFVRVARAYVERTDGDTDIWSRRSKALALEVGVFAAKIAATLGDDVTPEGHQAIQRLLTSAKAYAYNGYGDADFWRGRCEALCAAACETGLALVTTS